MPSQLRNSQVLLDSQALVQLKPSASRRSIQVPARTIDSLATTAEMVREQLEIVTRQRGFIEDSAVVVGEFLAIIDPILDRLDTIEAVIVELVLSGYAGLYAVDITGLSDVIPATWTTITYPDTISAAGPRGATVNLTNDSVAFNIPSEWQVSITFNTTFNELNASRRFELRMFNITKAEAVAVDWVIGVGRNTDATNFSTTLIFNIDSDEV
ncbi:unnamed protein product, partial [marine sediment metagenome]